MHPNNRLTVIYSGLFTYLLLLASCAQIVAPTGGVKDSLPPKVEKEYPANKSTHFSGSRIVIKFDEYIQLKDAEEQIVISPPLPEKPLFTVSGKSLIIQLMGPLTPGITYTFNFGNSIADNHEGIVLTNYSYVFSTGSNIDTLSVSGSLKQAFDLKTEKGISVCLYPIDSFSDSTIFKKKPSYFTKTTETGFYTLSNLPDERFKLVAFKDENKNLKYDKGEVVGFMDTTIRSADTLSHKPLYYFKPNLYPINKLVDTFSKEQGKFLFVVYKPYNVSIKPITNTPYQTWYKKGKDQIDTFILFSNQWKNDSVLFQFKTPQTDTTLLLKPRKNNKVAKLELSLKKEVELNDTFLITLNQPYETFLSDTSKIKLTEDTTLVKPAIFSAVNKEIIKLFYPLKEKVKYTLTVKDSCFKDIYGQYSKAEKLSLTTKGLKDYSTLVLSVKHPKDGYQYIMQLINEGETKVFKEFTLIETRDINLDYVLPGKYRIKFIRDTNTNGNWDNGDYTAHKQPERIFYYPETITLRAYWDLEQTLDMSKIVD